MLYVFIIVPVLLVTFFTHLFVLNHKEASDELYDNTYSSQTTTTKRESSEAIKMTKVLKLLLAVVLWVIEYLFIFGFCSLPFGKSLVQVSPLLAFVAVIVYIFLCKSTWRLIFNRKNIPHAESMTIQKQEATAKKDILQSYPAYEILDTDNFEIRIIKEWADDMAERFYLILKKNQKIKIEIFIFLYTLANLHFIYNFLNNDKYNRKSNPLNNYINNFTERDLLIKKIFEDRLKNYTHLVSGNNYIFDKNLLKLFRNYQVQLLGKIFEQDEYSFFNVSIRAGDNPEIIQSYFTQSKVILALLEEENNFTYFLYALEGENVDQIKKETLRKTKELDHTQKFYTLLKNYNKFTAREIIDIFGFQINSGYIMTQHNLYHMESTYDLYIKYLTVTPKQWELKKYSDAEILEHCHDRNIFYAIDCPYDKDKLWDYFLLQYILDRYINSENWYTSYSFIFDKNEVEQYKDLLMGDKIIANIFKTQNEYPVKILDQNCLHIGIFTEEKSGIYFKILKVEPKEFYQIEYYTLIKKGEFADWLL